MWMKGKMAKAAGCHTAFISQVLNGSLHLSLEQAARLNSFFQHTKDEARFFCYFSSTIAPELPFCGRIFAKRSMQYWNAETF
jgi:hypothetical protein